VRLEINVNVQLHTQNNWTHTVENVSVKSISSSNYICRPIKIIVLSPFLENLDFSVGKFSLSDVISYD